MPPSPPAAARVGIGKERMQASKVRDILAGLSLVVFGLLYATHALTRYGLGSFAAMRPGMFPTLVGSALVVAGLVVLLSALGRRMATTATLEPVAWRPLVVILAAMAAFAVSIGRIGMVPAIFLLTGLAAFADDKLKPTATLLLATAISVLAVVIFRYGLGFPIVLLRAPF